MEDRTRIVPVKLADGTVVHVSATPLGGDEDVADIRGALSFAQITKTIESVAQELNSCIDRVKPDKASVEFGVEIAVESGGLTALIVKGAAKGNLKITLAWEPAKRG
jgi:hypothetical protein